MQGSPRLWTFVFNSSVKSVLTAPSDVSCSTIKFNVFWRSYVIPCHRWNPRYVSILVWFMIRRAETYLNDDAFWIDSKKKSCQRNVRFTESADVDLKIKHKVPPSPRRHDVAIGHTIPFRKSCSIFFCMHAHEPFILSSDHTTAGSSKESFDLVDRHDTRSSHFQELPHKRSAKRLPIMALMQHSTHNDTNLTMMMYKQQPAKEASSMQYNDYDDDDETLSYYDEDCLFLPQQQQCSADTFDNGIRVELLWDLLTPSPAAAPVSIVETDDDDDDDVTWIEEDEEETLADEETVALCPPSVLSVKSQDIFRPGMTTTTILANTSKTVLPPHPVSPCTESPANTCWLWFMINVRHVMWRRQSNDEIPSVCWLFALNWWFKARQGCQAGIIPSMPGDGSRKVLLYGVMQFRPNSRFESDDSRIIGDKACT